MTLGQLGNLYKAMHRLEDAVQMYQRAAEIHVRLKDLRWEGVVRSNLADALIQLGRYEDARREILRAIACKSHFGVAAEPWTSWAILYDLETATGNPAAASAARAQAIEAYAAYRAQGGESQSNMYGLIVKTYQAIQAGEEPVFAEELKPFLQQALPPYVQALIRQLLALLQGERSAGLAEDPALYYDDAVELRLLIEALGQG
jgi:tetratricopeptide (TPR) repeat protein